MSKVVVMDHPLIEQKIGIIRRKETGTKDFRQNISEIAMLIGYEATKDLKLEEVEIETPICKTTVKQLKGKKLALVPILRAGLGMVDGMLSLIPAAKVGHIGLYRDPETLKPVGYCRARCFCSGSHAGYRRFFHRSHPAVKGQGLQEHPSAVHHRCTRRCKSYAGSTSGCGYLYRSTGSEAE